MVFDDFDDDNSGTIEYKELNKMLRRGAGAHNGVGLGWLQVLMAVWGWVCCSCLCRRIDRDGIARCRDSLVEMGWSGDVFLLNPTPPHPAVALFAHLPG